MEERTDYDDDLERMKADAADEEAADRAKFIEENDIYCPRCMDAGCYYCEG